jgi:hypothetical protein
MTMNPRLAAIAAAASLLLLGCEPYERVNPLDPALPLEVRIEGPDTIFSVNDTVAYRAVTDSDRADLPFVWSVSDLGRLKVVDAATGTITSLTNGEARVRATLGSRTYEKTVVVSQRPVRLRLTSPNPVTEFASLGEGADFNAAVVDERGVPVPGGTVGLVWTSLNPAVADVVNGRVTARGNGETWIRATVGTRVDSALVRVQQVPTSLQFGSDIYVIGLPGGTVQRAPIVRDARGNAINNPSGLTLTSSRSTFQVTNSGLVQAQGFGSTVLTARLGTLQATTNVRVAGGAPPTVQRLSAVRTALNSQTSGHEFLLIELDARDGQFDMDEARFDVYSTTETWLTTRLLPLDQGVADVSTHLAISPIPTAGRVEVRLRDAALNNSAMSQVAVRINPVEGSPDVIVRELQFQAGTIEIPVTVIPGSADLRRVYVFAFTPAHEVVFSRSWAVTAGGDLVLPIALPPGTNAAFLGVLVSDVVGNLSLIRTRNLP